MKLSINFAISQDCLNFQPCLDLISDIPDLSDPNVSAVDWLVTLFTDIGECACIVHNGDLIAIGEAPVDCSEMENIHAMKVMKTFGRELSSL